MVPRPSLLVWTCVVVNILCLHTIRLTQAAATQDVVDTIGADLEASDSSLSVSANGTNMIIYSNRTNSSPTGETVSLNGTLVSNDSLDPLYELTPEGALSINVTALWVYYVENGELPEIPETVMSIFNRLVSSLDFSGAFALLRNQTFFDAFMTQLGTSFPQRSDWIDGIIQSRGDILVPQSSSGGSDMALIVGIVLAVVAFIIMVVCAVFFILYRRRKRNATHPDGVKVIYAPAYDDSLSLKSVTTLALSVNEDGTMSRANSLSAGDDPVLQWIKGAEELASDSPTSSGSSGDHSRADMITEFLSNLQFQWDELKLVKSLGCGACGKVYLARWNETAVAVKVILDARDLHNKAPSSPSYDSRVLSATGIAVASPRRMLEEIKITAALRHPNVVQFMGFCLHPPSMAAEYCPRGSLYHVLHEQPKPALSWLRRVAFAADGAAGMLHLHSRHPQILHRDLNSPNLLVAADWTVKVADMGLSKLLTDSALEHGMNYVMTSGGGINPRWLAPEILSGSNCTTSSDVFSFGVIMWEILTRRVPWDGETTWSIVGSVQSGARLPLTRDIFVIEDTHESVQSTVEDYVELLQACWAHDSKDRPDFVYIAQKLREIQRRLLQNFE